ncbi:MAG: hypothetical protein R2851_15620 [Caldilineaceae bacterium]
MLKGHRLTFGACFAALLVLLGAGAASAAPVYQEDAPTCHGATATIVHVGYDTTVVGTDADDVIVVDGGWNNIHGGAGDDKICVSGHFNAVYAEEGDDVASAGGLYNNVYGGDGDDTLDVDDGSSFMQGGSGDNTCNDNPC